MKNDLWEKCVSFHGHSCGGLAIGYQVSMYAMELLEAGRAEDEELVCIAECDACSEDAIQVLLGCTLGKGNLLLKLRGKQAYSFYNRKNGKSVRLVLRETPEKNRDERLKWLMEGDFHDMFNCNAAPEHEPEQARIFKNYTCKECGERTAESHIHLVNGEYFCEECYKPYRRIY